MRSNRFEILLAGMVLALTIFAPTRMFAAPEPVESALPPPTASDEQTPQTRDAQIADQLRAIISSGQLERRIDRGPERKAVEAFYAARNYAPLWLSEGQINARAKSVIAHLKNAAADGLDPAEYPVPDFSAAYDAGAAADNNIKLTNSVLTYARHLAVGRVAPTRVLAEVDYGNHTPDPTDILRKVAEGGDAGTALESYNPP